MTSPLRFLFFTILFLLPDIALAHSPIKGIGDFLNGMLHPLLVPTQLLVILTLGLWYGQHQPSHNQQSVLLFLSAIIVGLITTGLMPSLNMENIALLLLLCTTVIGLLVITALPLPSPILALAGLLTGFLLGLDSAQETLVGKALIASLFGSGVGIYFLLLYTMALSESLSKKTWQTIAVRIIASWISTSALMVLALQLFPKTGG